MGRGPAVKSRKGQNHSIHLPPTFSILKKTAGGDPEVNPVQFQQLHVAERRISNPEPCFSGSFMYHDWSSLMEGNALRNLNTV